MVCLQGQGATAQSRMKMFMRFIAVLIIPFTSSMPQVEHRPMLIACWLQGVPLAQRERTLEKSGTEALLLACRVCSATGLPLTPLPSCKGQVNAFQDIYRSTNCHSSMEHIEEQLSHLASTFALRYQPISPSF